MQREFSGKEHLNAGNNQKQRIPSCSTEPAYPCLQFVNTTSSWVLSLSLNVELKTYRYCKIYHPVIIPAAPSQHIYTHSRQFCLQFVNTTSSWVPSQLKRWAAEGYRASWSVEKLKGWAGAAEALSWILRRPGSTELGIPVLQVVLCFRHLLELWLFTLLALFLGMTLVRAFG